MSYRDGVSRNRSQSGALDGNAVNLILHIGGHKTGSTLIQQIAVENRAELRAEGVLYPACERAWRGYQHSNIALGLARGHHGWVDRILGSFADLA